MGRERPRDDRRRRPRSGRAHAAVVAAAAWVLVLAVGASCLASGPEPPRRITLDEWGVAIEFRAADEKVASEVAKICRESLPVLARELGLERIEPFDVFLISDIHAYEEKAGFTLPTWGVAFAFPQNRFMLVDVPRAADAWNTLEKVIPHELSHLLLAQRVPGVRFPVWFMEGLAQWQAGQWSVVESWRLMESVWGNTAPALSTVVSYMPAEETRARDAYRIAYAAFEYRFDEHTEQLAGFLDEVARKGDFGEAFAAFWHETEPQFYARFDEYIEHKYGSRLMLFQTGPLFTFASVLFVFAVLIVWIRNRRKLKRMEAAERQWPMGPE